MKTKNIFNTLVLAAVLVSACSKIDIADDSKGYTLPVTINVTRQGDEPATRATYNESTKKLSFSTGDKLFVKGSYNEGENTFAGMLDYVSDGKFSGTIISQTEWTGTIEELLSEDGGANATLLPAGYGEYGYFSIADEGTYGAYLSENSNKAFATSKATAVEQFSWEYDYDYSNGFELRPSNAILNFTINGLVASTEVDVSFSYPHYPDPIVISGKVTTGGDGTATFAIGIIYGNNLKDCTLTVDGNNIAMPTKTTESGKIYNISRSAKAHALSTSVFGEIVGSDGMAYAVADKDKMPSGVTAAGMVAYKNGSNGLVIALADEANTMNWSTATGASGAAAHTPVVTGGTWKLPSKAEWNQMFGDDADTDIANYSNLNFYISYAGGTDLQDGYYWSSTETGEGIAYVELDCGSANWRNDGYEEDKYHVRACLAF